MAGVEFIVLAIAAVMAAAALAYWYGSLARMPRLRRDARLWLLLAGAWPLCLLALLTVLRRLAAADVRDAPEYLLMYSAIGAGWLGAATFVFDWFGISPVDDAMARNNRAAGHAVCGAMAGVTLCFAGANVGNGPGWWVVLICAALSTAAWLALWALVESITGAAETITVGRDARAGSRLGCLLAACGLVLGRSVAGDWRSVDVTLADFLRLGWPAAVLALAEAVLGRAFAARSPAEQAAGWLSGAGVGLTYLAAAGIYVALCGTV